MDSSAPNKIFAELAPKLFSGADIRPEYTWGNSRFDFYIEQGDRKILCEVKGVTLENDGVAMFPDAPTERGLKHVRELILARSAGFEACVVFIVKMMFSGSSSPKSAAAISRHS
jgi:sugar fermentation stimulation protein A